MSASCRGKQPGKERLGGPEGTFRFAAPEGTNPYPSELSFSGKARKVKIGGLGGTRTPDALLRTETLYPLSYEAAPVSSMTGSALGQNWGVVVGWMEFDLRLEGCRSLKDKRQILRSLIDRIRRNLHASVAETGDQELWGNACIGIAVAACSAAHAEQALQAVERFVEELATVEVVGCQRGIERV
jgi:uncharacterized protein YlxP (DUF503 family)